MRSVVIPSTLFSVHSNWFSFYLNAPHPNIYSVLPNLLSGSFPWCRRVSRLKLVHVFGAACGHQDQLINCHVLREVQFIFHTDQRRCREPGVRLGWVTGDNTVRKNSEITVVTLQEKLTDLWGKSENSEIIKLYTVALISRRVNFVFFWRGLRIAVSVPLLQHFTPKQHISDSWVDRRFGDLVVFPALPSSGHKVQIWFSQCTCSISVFQFSDCGFPLLSSPKPHPQFLKGHWLVRPFYTFQSNGLLFLIIFLSFLSIFLCMYVAFYCFMCVNLIWSSRMQFVFIYMYIHKIFEIFGY